MQDKEVLLSISSNHKMDRFLGVSNNLHFIEYRDYFRIGARKGFFEPLVFLNLFDKQARIIDEFLKGEEPKPSEAINHLKSLPLNEEQKHVLFGIILKYYGGYPVIKGNDGGAVYAFCLDLADEFLGYVGDTPEKEFCKRDWRETSLDSKRLNEAFDLVKGCYLNTDNIDIDREPIRNDIDSNIQGCSKHEKLKILNTVIQGYNKQIHNIFYLNKLVNLIELIKNEVEAEPEINSISTNKGFNLGYSETQLKALHKALTDNNFLDNQTKEAHFINAFNGEVLTNFEKLKWIDKTPKNNAGETGFNTQTLLEFLYLLEMETLYYDTLPSNQENFYRLIERVFEGIVNIQAKNVTKTANQKTQRQKLLNTILQGFKS